MSKNRNPPTILEIAEANYIASSKILDGKVVNDDKELPRKRSQYWFGACLTLSDKSFEAQGFIKWMTEHENQYPMIYILHDNDVYEEGDIKVVQGEAKAGDEKGPHIHFMWRMPTPYTGRSCQNFFKPWLEFVSCISNEHAYAQYMIHDTPDSMRKTRYSIEQVQGTPELIKKFYNSNNSIIQNRNLVQLADITDSNCGCVSNIFRDVCATNDSELIEHMRRFQPLLLAMAKEQKYEDTTNLKTERDEALQRAYALACVFDKYTGSNSAKALFD